MAIYYEFEFDTRTPVGFAHCTTCEMVVKDYRDIANVEKVVDLIKKLFSNKNYRNQCVTLLARTHKKVKHEVVRLWHNYDKKYDLVIFEGVGSYSILTKDKVDAKLIRELYLNCADYTNDLEAEEEEEKAV